MSSEVAIKVGRRKSASARVRLVPGSGNVSVNKSPLDVYFKRDSHRFLVQQPLIALGLEAKYDVIANVGGGGKSGQAGAIRLGIARALLGIDQDYHATLKPLGMLTRDPRKKERKKYGLAKARKRFQFSKR